MSVGHVTASDDTISSGADEGPPVLNRKKKMLMVNF